jgi:hypothetical protein
MLHTYTYWLLYKFGMNEYCNRHATQRNLKTENNLCISYLSNVTFHTSMTSVTQHVHLWFYKRKITLISQFEALSLQLNLF